MTLRRLATAVVGLALLASSTSGESSAAGAGSSGDGSARSSDQRCAGCHTAEARQSEGSIHARAGSPGLLGQLHMEGEGAQSLACLRCHAPSADQHRIVADGHLNPAYRVGAEREGIGCSVCHPKESTAVADDGGSHRLLGTLDGAATCAGCHQFAAAGAVNGKPLENTAEELRLSIWGAAGSTCVDCHMPFGEHLFRGIHSPDLVAASVSVKVNASRQRSDGAVVGELVVFNDAVGHDFPTYTTPRVLLQAELEDAQGSSLGPVAEQSVARQVRFEKGRWVELTDTRVAPRASQALAFHFAAPASRVVLHTRVVVQPDFAYVDIYEHLLSGALDAAHRKQVEDALAAARGSSYVIHDQRQPFP